MNQEKIGKFIEKLRKKNNLTQKEFADMFLVTPQAVSKWEKGKSIPDIEILKNISSKFNINIDSIVNGKMDDTTHKNKIYIICSVLIILLIIFIFSYMFFSKNDFYFNSISSSNSDFLIKGVAAYSSDKKSIYISSIDYLNNMDEDYYKILECFLEENHDNTTETISNCSNESTSLAKLNDLLKGIEFNVNDYSSICKDLNKSNLFITINAVDVNNKTVTYKIPLEFSSNCN